MKIKAYIPVEKIQLVGAPSFFRHEALEVKVVRLMRYPVRNRWHYLADVTCPPAMHVEGIRAGVGGTYRVNVYRCGKQGLNPKWVPPSFPDGVHELEIRKPEVAR